MIGLLFFSNLLYGNSVVEQEIKEKYSHSKLSNEAKIDILNNLNIYMKGEDKSLLSEKISMAEIAKKLNVSTQQISQVINEKTNLNFNDYVNSYRIEEAKKMLLSNTFSKLTIDAISQKSGFRSKSAFYVVFKKHTGNTPKEFISASEDSTPTQLENVSVSMKHTLSWFLVRVKLSYNVPKFPILYYPNLPIIIPKKPKINVLGLL
jgi:AraC-like DNA-binding protein